MDVMTCILGTWWVVVGVRLKTAGFVFPRTSGGDTALCSTLTTCKHTLLCVQAAADAAEKHALEVQRLGLERAKLQVGCAGCSSCDLRQILGCEALLLSRTVLTICAHLRACGCILCRSMGFMEL